MTVLRSDGVTYLLLASLELTLLCFGSAQLALQVQGFRLGRSLFGQNPLHAVVHLQTRKEKHVELKFSSLCLHGLQYSSINPQNNKTLGTGNVNESEQANINDYI